MNIFKKIYCRSFQTVFKIALPFLPYRKPKIVSALSDIPSVLNKKKKSCPVIITDPGIAKLGILSMLTDVFDNAGIVKYICKHRENAKLCNSGISNNYRT